jgi:HSP20 family protein
MDFPSPRFSDFLDEFFSDALAAKGERGTFLPNVDISEDNEKYHIEVSLPGMKKEDIKMDLKDNTLTISGERIFEKEKKDKQYHLMESSYGKFSRSFNLSEGVDKESIDARFKDGILYIDLKKAEEKVSKEIKIK